MRVLVQKPNPDVALNFIRNVLGQDPWDKQEQMIRAVFGPKRTTAVRACTGAGKTKGVADAALAWVGTGPFRTVITTAPTARQVKELLWKEIRISYKHAARRGTPVGGYMPPLATELRIDDGWLAIGFSPKDEVNAAGWHSIGGTLAILDEAIGVPQPIWDTILATLVGENDRILAIANPTVPSGPFYDLFRDDADDVEKIHISAFDTPNVKAGREVIPGMTTLKGIEALAKKWGKNSPMYKAKVLGEFPDDADDILVPLSWVEKAFDRWEQLTRARAWSGDGRLGVDVARFGQDSSVAALRRDQGIQWLQKTRKLPTTETCGWIIRLLKESDVIVQVRIDADGLGAGIYDNVKLELGNPPLAGSAKAAMDFGHSHIWDVSVIDIHGGLPAIDPEMFFNRRSEWLWHIRTRLDPDLDNPIALPPDDELQQQLTSIRWRLTPKGQVRVESKEEMRDRGLSSPDEADSVAYALADLWHDMDLSPDPEFGHVGNEYRSI